VIRRIFKSYVKRTTKSKHKKKRNKLMHVNKSLETAEGTVKFEGELEQKELDLVLKIGLNYLLQMGALPFVNKVDKSVVDMEEYPKQ
jgi:hypothetical protein